MIARGKNNKVYLISLGCAKNRIDSEVILGFLVGAGYVIVNRPKAANIIVINTCAFVEEAKQESIEVILENAQYKRRGNCNCLVICGCMAQRYFKELVDSLKEVDLFIGTGEYHKIVDLLKSNKKISVSRSIYIHSELDPRILLTPAYTAFLKISEGCERRCSFCIIPEMRGMARSRTVKSLVSESKNLISQGVKELNLVAQDLSTYGLDLPGKEDNLENLLISLNDLDIKWIRLLYHYPDSIDNRFVDVVAQSKKILNYLDMPIQHFSDSVLKKMNRKITSKQIFEKIDLLRSKIPDIIFRTSLIVGFPGESKQDFNNLLKGVKRVQFNNLGVFKYSEEEGAISAKFKHKVSPKVMEDRLQKVYDLQRAISYKHNKKLRGSTLAVLVEGTHEESNLLLQGRYFGQAPEIDGKVIIDQGEARVGDIVLVKITDSHYYDLWGKIIE